MAEIIGDGERIEVTLTMLDDDTFDAALIALRECLSGLVLRHPIRAQIHDGFSVEDFG